MTDTPPPPAPDESSQPPAGQPVDVARPSHRGRRKASSVVLPVVFAVALVLVGFLGMWGWIAWSGGDDAGPVATPTTSAASPTPSPTPGTSSAVASPTTSDPSTATPSATPSSASPSPSPKPTKSARPDRSAPVVVFNQTSISGLAAAYAAKLQQAGWRVTGVDNWTGYVPETTVYYRPGDKAAARQLMRDLPTVNRMRAAVSGMPSQGLTLIIAGNATAP